MLFSSGNFFLFHDSTSLYSDCIINQTKGKGIFWNEYVEILRGNQMRFSGEG